MEEALVKRIEELENKVNEMEKRRVNVKVEHIVVVSVIVTLLFVSAVMALSDIQDIKNVLAKNNIKIETGVNK